MPIPGPYPSVADDDAPVQNGSPFWLGLNGSWLQLDGATPGASRSAERAQSELVTVDGFRYAQQAPRGAREWSLEWQYATPAALAALAVAAEAPGDVWLHDTAAAAANMLHPRDCYGADPAAVVVDCGGMPLRAFTAGTVVSTRVRAGVTTWLSMWTTATAGVTFAHGTYPGGSFTLNAGRGVPSSQQATAFAPTVDGTLSVTIDTANVSGLQLTEGPPPFMWLPGERTPCKVAVSDAERTLNLTPEDGQGLSDYSVTLREVG